MRSPQFAVAGDGARSRGNASIGKMASRKRNAILEDFIYIYKSEPCLWRVKCKDYQDRHKRAAAYRKLIKKLQELEPTATKNDVVKKINTFRSNFRREKKKYEESMKSGASSDDIQKPTLWYFDLFDFLEDQDFPRNLQSNILDSEENDFNEINESIENNTNNMGTTEDAADTNETYRTTSSPENISTQKTAQKNISRPSKKKADQDQITKDVLLYVRDRLKRPAPASTPEDRYDLLGRSIAIKLRSLEKRQSLIAEKIINDTLFDAEMGNLSTESYRRT